MTRRWTVERRVELGAPPDVVWARVVTPEGINHELRPWLTMSIPRGAGITTIDDVEVGVPVGRAWLRLFGVVPFDYDDLALAELEPGHRFREESTMASMRSWTHERTVATSPTGGPGGTVLTDRVGFVPRWWTRPAAPVLHLLVGALFSHRHRRLGRRYPPPT